MSTPALLVDLDLAVRRDRSVARVRSRHVLHDGTVHVLSSDGRGVRTGTFDVPGWRSELARTCRVTTAADASTSPGSGLELPWELVLGTGAATAARSPELCAELLRRAEAPVRQDLVLLHRATVGRLRAIGGVPGRGRIGWVTWVLFADGWRALTPCVLAGPTGPRAMLRLDRREPEDLVREIARWAAGGAR